MYMLNKLVWFFLNPLAVGMELVLLALVVRVWRKWLIAAAFAWLWVASMPITAFWLAYGLEKDYPVMHVEDLPVVDAVIDLGGGVGGCPEYPYVDLGDAADRAWHSVRIWRAGKAKVIVPTGVFPSCSDGVFLKEVGIPEDALLVEDKARNTEENAKLSDALIEERLGNQEDGARRKVIVVTTACHMRRSMLMFSKYAPELECIPAAIDHMALQWRGSGARCNEFLPDIGALHACHWLLHEYLGYYGYKWFR